MDHTLAKKWADEQDKNETSAFEQTLEKLEKGRGHAMVDIFGNTIKPGDKIIYSSPISTSSGLNRSTGKSPLVTGVVDHLMANNTIAVVNVIDPHTNTHRELRLKSQTILKYEWTKEVKPMK